MSQIERYGFNNMDGLSVKSNGNYVLYEAHRKREEELLGMLQLLVYAIEFIPGGSVMKRITNEACALLVAALIDQQMPNLHANLAGGDHERTPTP